MLKRCHDDNVNFHFQERSYKTCRIHWQFSMTHWIECWWFYIICMPFFYLKKMWFNVAFNFLVWPELSVCLDGSSRDRHVSFVPVLGCEECLRNQEDPYLTESRGFGKVFKPSGQRLNCDQFMQQVGTSWWVEFIDMHWDLFHVISRSYLYNGNPYTWKYVHRIEAGPC